MRSLRRIAPASPVALADALAQALIDDLAHRPMARLIVCGGATAREVLPRLGRSPLPWRRVVVTLADERWVAPDHPDSNERLVRDTLMAEAAGARLVGLKTTHATPEAAVDELAARLAAEPWPAAAVFLSMGPDGHVASLFPGDAQGLTTDAAVRACRRPDHPRVSLGPRLLLNTRRVVLAVRGAERQPLLAEALRPGPLADLPVRLLLHQDRVPVDLFAG